MTRRSCYDMCASKIYTEKMGKPSFLCNIFNKLLLLKSTKFAYFLLSRNNIIAHKAAFLLSNFQKEQLFHTTVHIIIFKNNNKHI